MFSAAGLVAVIATLAAAGMGRDLLVRAFAGEVPVNAQRVVSIAFCVGAVAVGLVVCLNAAKAGIRAPLFALVLSCVLLRRAMPVRVTTGTLPTRFGFLFFFVAFQILRSTNNLDFYAAHSQSSGDASEVLVEGSLVMLFGVLIAGINWLKLNPAQK